MTQQEKTKPKNYWRDWVLKAGLGAGLLLGSSAPYRAQDQNGSPPHVHAQEEIHTPKAKLVLIGGAISPRKHHEPLPENAEECRQKIDPHGILQKLIALASKPGDKTHKPSVVVITCAGGKRIEDEKEVDYAQLNAADYAEELPLLGAGDITTIRDRTEANDATLAEKLKHADLIFFSGGDQKELVRKFKNTAAFKIVKERYENDANLVIAGTSAGAMAMSDKMLYEDEHGLEGFGFTSFIIDTHADRQRFDGDVAIPLRGARRGINAWKSPHEGVISLEENMGIIIDATHHAIELFGNPRKGAHFLWSGIGDGDVYQSVGKAEVLLMDSSPPAVRSTPVTTPASR